MPKGVRTKKKLYEQNRKNLNKRTKSIISKYRCSKIFKGKFVSGKKITPLRGKRGMIDLSIIYYLRKH